MKNIQPFRPLGIEQREYGVLANGQVVTEFTLHNGRGASLSVINYGGTVTSLCMPDRHGHCENIVLNLGSLEAYVAHTASFGCIVGRYANRIENGRFFLDGKLHQLAVNDGAHTLHGGAAGLSKQFWNIVALPLALDLASHDQSVSVLLSIQSDDGEQGFPGTLAIDVCYTLTATNEWHISYRAISDKTTILNLSSHCYFNLSGSTARPMNAAQHTLMLNADLYTTVNSAMIPTELCEVSNTPFDFRKPTVIADRISQHHAQLELARGYDHNFVIKPTLEATVAGPLALQCAATLSDLRSGRGLEIFTTEPGIQLYSGNHLGSGLKDASGKQFQRGDGVCLETQHFPNSPNRPDFPSTLLEAGQVYKSTTKHRFFTLTD